MSEFRQDEGFMAFARSAGLIHESYGLQSVVSGTDLAWLAWQAARAQPEHRGDAIYSQGICGDGAAILKNGQPMTVDEIVAGLNAKPVPDEEWGEVFAEVRDNILFGRDRLDGVLDGDQTNAVLDEVDRLDVPRAADTFQSRVQPWMLECFGEMIAGDRKERNHRFLEEALELVQSCGCTASEAHQLVDYVFGRPVGEPKQESGGVSVTHAALCLANDIDMHDAAEVELARIWTKVEAIRAKQGAKPKHSPLPQQPAQSEAAALKGVGRITGDGWKDTTTIGQVVFVWNAELPKPYAPGQFPRIGNPIWSASRDQYDFVPATAVELREFVEARIEQAAAPRPADPTAQATPKVPR